MGHGHVTPNPDGSKARCGGPGICTPCSREKAAQSQQPAPQPGREDVSPVARARFLETFDAQEQAGVATYGVTLQVGNGRDFGRDAREELVDAFKYVVGLEMEREELFAEVIRLRTENYALRAQLSLLPPGHPDAARPAPREEEWR